MGDFVRPDWSGRLSQAWQRADDPPRAAFVVSSPTNITYLCGFEGSQGLLVLTASGHRLILDGRYASAARGLQAAGALGPVEIRHAEGRLDIDLAAVLRELPAGDIAFEADVVTVAGLGAWQRSTPDRTWSQTSGLVEALRIIKDQSELRAMRRSCARLSDVARGLRDFVTSGSTEREVAAAIDGAIMRAGFSKPAFQTIVASGPNSALPHARPTDRRLSAGDLVVLDFGGVLDGYCSDLTRMAAVGQVQADARALVDAVRAAQDAALATVRAGALASDVDKAARQVLTSRGLGEAFLHATGHGLGLDLHEAPRIGRADADRVLRLETGMVCTIEPGAYVDGLGGARVEDDVVVTVEGCEALTDAPRDLLIV